MDSFDRKRLLNNSLGIGLISVISIGFLYAASQPNSAINLGTALLIWGGVLLGVYLLIRWGERNARLRLAKWADANSLAIWKWRGLAFYEIPDEWKFPTREGDEVNAYAVIVVSSEGKRTEVLLAWHKSFGDLPQVIWCDLEKQLVPSK